MAFGHSRFGDVEIDHGHDSTQQDPLVQAGAQEDWASLWMPPGTLILSSVHRMHAEAPRLCVRDCPGL